MIKITFDEPDTDEWKRWRKDCEKETEKLIQAAERREMRPDIPKKLHRRRDIKEIYRDKEGSFHGKCAYCECYITDFQPGDIEHFRPKRDVRDENDDPVMVKYVDDNPVPHPGYYWLAFDWKNLLPSCSICNKEKKNRFPVIGPHAVVPEEVKDEKPLLINPVTDDPAKYLFVDIDTGLMGSDTDEGKMCIKIFSLNHRDRLPEERLKAINEVKAKLLDTMSNSPKKEDSLNQLHEMKQGKSSYSMAVRAALENPEKLFSENIWRLVSS